MAFIDRISSITATETERYLKGLPSDEVHANLKQSNAAGTPLHIATSRGDFELTKVLLNFDAVVASTLSGKSVEESAKELHTKNPKDKNRQRIYALVRSWGRWQSVSPKGSNLLFARSAQTIEDLVPIVQKAVGKSGVLFLGISGEGKSTLVNYFWGTRYALDNQTWAQVKPLGPEIVSTGNSTVSQTLFPEVVPLSNHPYVLIDMQGFEDTHGAAERVAAMTSIYMLVQQLSALKALLLITSWGALADTKMTQYRKAAQQIGDMGGIGNVILVVTKPEKNTSEKSVRDRLLALSQEWKGSNAPVDSIRRVTDAILSHPSSILVIDVTEDEGRGKFHSAIDLLQDKKTSDFDFSHYSSSVALFRALLEPFIWDYIELATRLATLRDQLDKKVGAIKAKQDEIDRAENEKQAALQKSTAPFDATSDATKRIESELNSLRSQLASTTALKNTADAQLRSYQSDLIAAELNANRGSDAHPQIDALFKERWQYLRGIFPKTSFTQTENRLSNSLSSNASALSSLKNQVLTSYFQECFGREEFLVQAIGRDIWTDTWSAAFDKAIQLCSNTREAEEASSRAQQLRSSIQSTQRSQSEFQNAIWRLQDQIAQKEIEQAKERQSMQNKRTFHEEQQKIAAASVVQLEKNLKMLEADMALLSSEKALLEDEISISTDEQEVNQDLFAKIKTILKMLNLKGPLFDQFMMMS